MDGPFAETRELVAGFWIWEVKDMDEAVAWVKRCPNPVSGPSEIEIRPLFDMADFAESLTPPPVPACLRHVRVRQGGMGTGDTRRAIEAVFRIERAGLIAGLARLVRDIGLAEELAQDAVFVALTEWPAAGLPRNPGAWLMTAAKRRAIDAIRRDKMRARKHAEIAREPDGACDGAAELIDLAMDDDVGDELLPLLFTACHPVLSAGARTALTLRVIGGLTTDEIARAYCASEATISQRIVRAKQTIARAGLRFEVPRGADRAPRLVSVPEVIYLILNEGYAATAGDDLVRPSLCLEALRLGRVLARAAARLTRSTRTANTGRHRPSSVMSSCNRATRRRSASCGGKMAGCRKSFQATTPPWICLRFFTHAMLA